MAVSKLNLTGGNAPFDPADPRTFPNGFTTFENSVEAEVDSKVSKTGAETVAGTKTFTSPPVVPTPTNDGHAATKAYVDGVVVSGGVSVHNDLTGRDATTAHPTSAITGLDAALSARVTLTGDQSIAGVKTFTSSPVVPLTPTTTTQAASKGYTDTGLSTKVGVSGSESISGVKTFTSSPIVPDPTTAQQAASKAYVDANAGEGGPHDHNSTYVALTGNQTVAGVKTFSSSPVVPLTPTTTTQAASKGYVDTAVAAAPFPATGGITIIEITTGVWSANAPSRAVGVNPIEFRGWSDPAGGSGIATPANINASDIWTREPAP
jgi:hypothetical protein